MTKLLCTLTALCALLAATSAFARIGGAGDAGGGHGFSSTPEEIHAYAANLPGKDFSLLQANWGWAADRFEVAQLLNPDYAPNDTVKRIDLALQRAYAGKSLFDELKKTKIEARDDCRNGKGEIVDSSTPHKLGATFCINARTLSRYPTESLKPELISLLFHEWSHQLGYGESEAVEFQNYVKNYIGIVLATFDDPVFPVPMRIGGSQTIKQGDAAIRIRCMTAEQYGREWGNRFQDSELVLLKGQSMKIRGKDTFPQTITCGDLPELDCTAPVKSPNSWCGGKMVYFGANTDKDWFCVDDPSSSQTYKYADLLEERVCRPAATR